MEKLEPKITIMVDIDDVLFPLVEHWIYYYKTFIKSYDYLAYSSHDKHLNKSMVVSWDVISCLKPTDTDMFWNVLGSSDFWRDMTADPKTVNALKAINDNPNIDLIICTDTYYKSATTKLTRFFELFPFITPSQVICMKENGELMRTLLLMISQRLLKIYAQVQSTICSYKNLTTMEHNDNLRLFMERVQRWIGEILYRRSRCVC